MAAIQTSIEYLEAQDRNTAEVVRQLALQSQEMITGMQTLARKVRLLTYVVAVATIIALVATVKAFS